jgi:hypothetical protein
MGPTTRRLEVTANVGGGFSDVPQGNATGIGCPSMGAPSRFS